MGSEERERERKKDIITQREVKECGERGKKQIIYTITWTQRERDNGGQMCIIGL